MQDFGGSMKAVMIESIERCSIVMLWWVKQLEFDCSSREKKDIVAGWPDGRRHKVLDCGMVVSSC